MKNFFVSLTNGLFKKQQELEVKKDKLPPPPFRRQLLLRVHAKKGSISASSDTVESEGGR